MKKGYRFILCIVITAALGIAAAAVSTRVRMAAFYITHRGVFDTLAETDDARRALCPDEDYVGYYNAGSERSGGDDILSAAEDIQDCFGHCEIWRREGYGLMAAVRRVPVGNIGKYRSYCYIYKDGEWSINVTVGYIG